MNETVWEMKKAAVGKLWQGQGREAVGHALNSRAE